MGATTAYPNLGFDPAPGSTESVSVMQQRISRASTSMLQANDLMNGLRNDNSGVWQGAAGDAFRSHLDSTLIEDLAKANQSLNTAVTALKGWSSSLTRYQERAADLERQAADAQADVTTAQGKQQSAAASPDLNLAGQYFDNETDLQNAQRRLDRATMVLRDANTELDAAADALAHLRKLAQELHDEWDAASGKVAEALKEAARFAPQKGLLSRIGNGIADGVSAVGDWVKDHLDDIHSVLSTVSAVAGLIALCTPPPIDVVALAVSLVAGAGALATTLADSKVRGDIGEMFHGDFKGNWGSAIQLGGDVVGLIPGVGVASKAAKGTELLAEGARGFPKIVDIVSEVAHDPGFLMKGVTKYVPYVGETLEKVKLLEPGAAESAAKTADMLNFLNKSVGSAKKTVTTTWDQVTGGDD
ncbi:membrane protein [Winogradskya consettensis]|uniref:Membrane protein n=1 Tax=Winogradskya consettensis TaxID=113560 RepID=A0A919VQ56_9ACTN|nr:hypothetical protein [Actinoplanes consettensis]GIM71817.1 membrane protein [Actinoplanes consettensis]